MFLNPRHSLFRSIRFRLAMSYGAVFALCLLLVFLLLSFLLRRAALRHTDAFVVSEARRMLDLAARRKVRILESEINRFARHHGADTVSLILWFRGGEVLVSPDGAVRFDAARPPAALPPGRAVFNNGISLKGRRIRMVTLTSEEGHTLCLCRSLEDFDRDLRVSGWVLFAAFASSLCIGTVLASLLTGRLVRRIEQVRMAAEVIARGDLTRRVPLTGDSDEVAALAGTFNRMIEKIESTLDELRLVTDSMAHDLRTPLTRMRGVAERALTPGVPVVEQEEALSSVVEECDRLDRMSATLLQIARMDAGVYVPAVDGLDFREIVSGAVELFSPAYEDKGVVLEVCTLPEKLCVKGDRPLLERVLANLLDNALKFTPPGGRVSVRAEAGNGSVQLTVTDTGIGIEETALPRVFDRFYRSDGSRSMPGSGLGLSFVRSAVRSQGGDVRIDSRPGMGTTLTVSFPQSSPV